MSMKMKTGIIVVGLLVVVGLFNYVIKMDPTQLAARGVGRDAHSHGDEHAGAEEGKPGEEDLRTPIGPEGAPVLIQVIAAETSELEMPLRPMMSSIAADYPEYVRVEFPAPNTDEFKELNKVTHGSAGLLINGEMIKEIPEARLGFVTFQGSPALEDWTEQDVRLAIEHELEKAGIEFTPRAQHAHSGAEGPAGEADAHAGHSH